MIVCIVLTAAGLYNVYSDNADVRHLADLQACDGKTTGCDTVMTRMERSPFSQEFELSTSKKKVLVRCARPYVFFGDYACRVQ